MNIHAAAVLFVIGSTAPSAFSSDVAARHHRALQSKNASVGGNRAIDRCIEDFTGTYSYASDCNGVAFLASLGCTANQICTYSESQFADMAVCPDSEIRQPSDCVLSGSFDATEHVDPRTCEVKVFKLSGKNCNYQGATTPTGVRINPNESNDDGSGSIGIYFEKMDNAPKILSSTKDDIKTRRLEQNFVGVLYSKSVDDHRYLANGDVTTGDKMKVLDVHRRRLQCTGANCPTTNGKAALNQRYLADDYPPPLPYPSQCRARGEDCARFTIDSQNAFCKSLKECEGCLKDSDCVEGSCTKTVADPDRPKSTFTVCVIPENCRAANGLPVDMSYTTCNGADAFQPMGSGSGYNTDCCGDKTCITSPATPLFVQPAVPEYNYCGDVCIKKKNCGQFSAHAQEAECGDSDTYACCSDDVRERNWKLKSDTCGRRTGQGGKCNPGTEGAPNCDCAPRAGLCRWMCNLERTFCNQAFPFDCPNRTCCVGGKCDPFFQDGDVYTE